jgi:Protein of unknown function (DUF3105)
MAQRKSSASTRSRKAAQATARSRGSSPSAVDAKESAKASVTTADAAPVDAAATDATSDAPTTKAATASPQTKGGARGAAARSGPDTRATKAAGTATAARDAQTRSAKRPKGSQPLKTGSRPQPAKAAPGRRPPGNRPGKSIVNQRQTPWGLIAAAVVVVLFAGGVIAYAVTRSSGGSNADKPATATAAEIAKIPGIVHKTITSRNHVAGVVNYGNDSPPFGGDHNQYWAQCTGVVYDHQLANENAVHTLEHGAIWITYRPGLDQASISTLTNKVIGKNYMLLTPYAGLKTPISLQAWGYQLFVNSANDPRIDQFIKDLRLNPNVIPEYGASCDDPQFQASQSTPGHPFNG